MKKFMTALCVLLVFAVLAGCARNSGDSDLDDASSPDNGAPAVLPAWPPPEDARSFEDRTAETIQATITMEDGGVIVLELYPDLAPQSVRNFAYLARQGFYNGLTFHRIMSGFMIQGGCPEGTGSGNPGYTIRGEFSTNGFKNELTHTRGTVSMARRSDPHYDSAGSQFFIMHGNSPALNNDYAGFGRVISGMEVVDRIADIPALDNNGTVAADDRPVIQSVTIDSNIELPMPDRIT